MENLATDCKYYIINGKCKHRDAPKPGESSCIGKKDCGCYRKIKEVD